MPGSAVAHRSARARASHTRDRSRDPQEPVRSHPRTARPGRRRLKPDRGRKKGRLRQQKMFRKIRMAKSLKNGGTPTKHVSASAGALRVLRASIRRDWATRPHLPKRRALRAPRATRPDGRRPESDSRPNSRARRAALKPRRLAYCCCPISVTEASTKSQRPARPPHEARRQAGAATRLPRRVARTRSHQNRTAALLLLVPIHRPGQRRASQ